MGEGHGPMVPPPQHAPVQSSFVTSQHCQGTYCRETNINSHDICPFNSTINQDILMNMDRSPVNNPLNGKPRRVHEDD